MASKILELALRIRTDLAQGKKELNDFSKTLDSTSASAKKASQDLDKTSRSTAELGRGKDQAKATAKAVDDLGAAAQRSSSSQDKLGDSATRTLKDLREFTQTMEQTALTYDEVSAQEARLDRLMAQGTITIKDYDEAISHLDKAEADLNKEHQKQDRAMQGVLRTADRTAAELKKLDSAERQVTDAFRAGRISASEYDRALQSIGRRRKELEATRGAMGRLGLTSRDTRSQIITLSRSLATGNFESAGYDILRLGSTVDKTGMAFLRVLGPIALITGAVAGFALVVHNAWREQREWHNMMQLTGNYAGLTRAQYEALSRSIADSTEATIGQSREIVNALAATGKVNEEMIDDFARTIVRMQSLTGKSTDELVKEFVEMRKGVADWATEKNRSMHFLSAAELENIRRLEERGQVEEAMQIALSGLRVKELAHMGHIERLWVSIKNKTSEAVNATRNFGQALLDIGTESPERQLYHLEQAEQGSVLSRIARGEWFKQSDEDRDAQRKQLEELVAENERRVDEQAAAAEKAAKEIAQADQVRGYVTGLEKQVDAIGMTAAQLRKAEAAQAGLNEEQQLYVNGLLIQLKMEEQRQQAERDAQQLGQLKIQLLRAQGNEEEAARLEFENRFGEMMTRLEARGDDAGLAIINSLLDMSILRGRLDEAQAQIDTVLGDQHRREQSINAEREAGLITEAEARRRIVDLHKETFGVLEQQRPLLEDLAQTPGEVGEAAQQALDALNQQAGELLRTTNLLEATLRTALESGLTNAITGLADGTLTFRDAVASLAKTVIDAMIEMQAQQLAQSIVASGSGSGGWISSIASVFGFAQGGRIRGPGTGTSDSVPILASNDEFVTRASVMRQPGALNFMEAFNRVGMRALASAPINMPGYAEGGLVTDIPAPSIPSLPMPRSLPERSAAGEAGGGEMNVRIINQVSNQAIASAMGSPPGVKAILNVIGEHPDVIKRSVS